jgi:hypothetical protein
MTPSRRFALTEGGSQYVGFKKQFVSRQCFGPADARAARSRRREAAANGSSEARSYREQSRWGSEMRKQFRVVFRGGRPGMTLVYVNVLKWIWNFQKHMNRI